MKITVSLADGISVDLRDTRTSLDDTSIWLLLTAIRRLRTPPAAGTRLLIRMPHRVSAVAAGIGGGVLGWVASPGDEHDDEDALGDDYPALFSEPFVLGHDHHSDADTDDLGIDLDAAEQEMDLADTEADDADFDVDDDDFWDDALLAHISTAAAVRHGVTIEAEAFIGVEHVLILIVEAASLDAVRQFMAALPGAGDLTVLPAFSAEQAVEHGGCQPSA